jgi:hypothetical protein
MNSAVPIAGRLSRVPARRRGPGRLASAFLALALPLALTAACASSSADPHIVYGTPDAVLLCPGQIRSGCYSRRPIVITMSPAITAQADAAGTVIVATQNHNPDPGPSRDPGTSFGLD